MNDELQPTPLANQTNPDHLVDAPPAIAAEAPPPAPEPSFADQAAQLVGQLEQAVSRVVHGQSANVRLLLIALIVQGHALLEGAPGTAKTLMVRTLSRLSGLDFKRIQFTPDLMPSDITGTSIFRPDRATFEFRRGPIFTQLLLADEINRAPARTQAALLQGMQERIVSADGEDHKLDDIFCVVATQNPLESEGTYPLPEAELDRFLFKLIVDFPDGPTEFNVMKQHGGARTADEFHGLPVEPMLTSKQIALLRANLLKVRVGDDLVNYTLALLRSTREHPFLRAGASTRAGVMLLRAARASALLDGRMHVIPDDVKELAVPCLRHRVFRSPAAELDGTPTEAIVTDILNRLPVPR